METVKVENGKAEIRRFRKGRIDIDIWECKNLEEISKILNSPIQSNGKITEYVKYNDIVFWRWK